MFDVNHVSNMLKNARIKKNLTQSALAEKLGLTYQAVSNWERCNSLPDISNLPSICELLDINLYELLGASQNSGFFNRFLDGSCDLSKEPIENIALVAPLLPPEQLISALKNINTTIEDMSILVQLAPFVDKELLETLGKEAVPKDIGEIVALAPFVSESACAKWIDMLDKSSDFEMDVGLLSALGPFLPMEKLDYLSERVVPESLAALNSVAAFLSQSAMDKLADKVSSVSMDEYIIGIECLSPFLSKEVLKRLHKKVEAE
jgi:transcriptional regulator with XRE-family HTH domain